MRGDYYLLAITGIALIYAGWFVFAMRPDPAPTPTSHGGRTIATSTPELSASTIIAQPSSKNEVIRATELKIFGSIPYWDQPRAVAMFKKHVELFDFISVFWYRLDAQGNIVKYDYAKEDASLITFAHENDVKVLALIANLPEDDDWDPDLVERVIQSEVSRTAHINDILMLIEKGNFDGVNIDYEFLRDRQKDDFTLFIEELGTALRAEGKLLAVAIHAQTEGGETRGQDIPALQKHVDILSFMTYDEHWETGEPGPPASLPWVRKVLEHARSLGVDMQKIFMGIPLYGYDWPKEGDGWGRATGREYEDIVKIANTYDADVLFDEVAQTPYFFYRKDDVNREVWFENVESFTPRLSLAEEFGVAGVMFWRQGREDERIYEVLGE